MLNLVITSFLVLAGAQGTIELSGMFSYNYSSLSGIHHTEGHDYNWDRDHTFSLLQSIFRVGYFVTPNISVGIGINWYRYAWDYTDGNGTQYSSITSVYATDLLPRYTVFLSGSLAPFAELILGYGSRYYETSKAGTTRTYWAPTDYGKFYGSGFRYGVRAGLNYLVGDSAYLSIALSYVFSNYHSPNPDNADDEWWDIDTSGPTLELGAGLYIGSVSESAGGE